MQQWGNNMRLLLVLVSLFTSFTVGATPGDVVAIIHTTDEQPEFIKYARKLSCPNLVDYHKVYAFKRYRIDYKSTDAFGREVTTSGLMMVPVLETPTALFVYQHGTLFGRIELPSSTPLYREGDAMGFCFASLGYVTLLPDYLGFGDGTGVHPYLHADTEAGVARDFLRASKAVLNRLNVTASDKLFVAGYSQGGHAAMALTRLLESDPDQEFTVAATAPMAGPYSLTETIQEVMTRPTQHSAAEAAYIVMGLNPIYSFYKDLKDVIRPDYVKEVATLFDGSRDWPYVLKAMHMTPAELIQPEYLKGIADQSNSAFQAALEANEVYQWVPRSPIRFLHGRGDHEVPYSNSLIAFHYMAERGASVELINLGDDVDHAKGAVLAFGQAALWFESFVPVEE